MVLIVSKLSLRQHTNCGEANSALLSFPMADVKSTRGRLKMTIPSLFPLCSDDFSFKLGGFDR